MLIALLSFSLLGHAQEPAHGKAEVRLSWTYEGLPSGMRVFETSPKTPGVGTTATVDRLEDIPVGAEVRDGRVRMKPGEERTLVLVYRNSGKTPARFFAAPHGVKPHAAALGLEFTCLCMNHVYAAGPGRWWWRVVNLSLSPEFAAANLEITHALVRVTKDSVRGEPLPVNR